METRTSEQGRSAIIALVALVVVAVGALVFFSGQLSGGSKSGSGTGTEQTASAESETPSGVESAAGESTESASAKNEAGQAKDGDKTAGLPIIKPGNPVVAKINGKDVTRMDVFGFIQNLPPETRQMPIDKLFPLALEQVVNAELIGEKVKTVNLEEDQMVKDQMKAAKQQIIRSVFLQKEADKATTEDMLKSAYEDYKKNFPKIEEMKARHILVKDEALAKDLIKKIKDGGDFAQLAKENSIDATKENGGELNFFSKQDVVPEFADSAFALADKAVTDKPVKSQFGYHIIQALEKRERPPATYDQARPFLSAQLRGKALNGVVQKWREAAKIEVFDINGDSIEPASGDDTVGKKEEKKAE